MKRLLLSILMLPLISSVFSQVITQKDVLETASRNFRIIESNNYAKAVSMASEKGWSLTIQSTNGRKGTLIGVDPFGFPKYYITQNNTIAAATTRANQLWPGGSSGLNLSGSSPILKNKLAIWDGGKVLNTHVELIGRVTQKDNATAIEDHGTHVSGTMIASGVNPLAKGMAYGLQGLIAYDFSSDISEMLAEASTILLSNHSYSIISGWNYNSSFSRWEFMGRPNETEDYKFGFYSNDAQMLDSIAYNAPNYLIVKSAGNSRTETGPAVGSPYFRYNSSNQMTSAGNRPAGISSNDSYNTITWDCNAKNILTVGAVEGLPSGYNRKEDVVMSNFSSWGPTDDGRIKPDIVADGVNVLSSIASSNTSYASFNGTSMSAPNTTGSLLLLQEYWAKLKPGTFMRSATLKGLAIHTADEAGFYPGPDYQYGWGLLNVEKAAAAMTAALPSNNSSTSNHLLFENNLLTGQSFTTSVIASGVGPLTATICWTDVKGNVETVDVLNNPAKKLVNDLDIKITKGSSIYLPWILDPASPGASASRGDNITDNVERINVDSAVPGQTYIITVSHKGVLVKGQQAYSLLVSGVGGATYCTSVPTSTSGARIDSVGFKTIHYSNPVGCTGYTNNTNIIADIESAQTIPFTIKTGTCDATANPRVVTVYIDYNNNGVFDASEKVAQSAAITSSTGSFTGSIVTPNGLTIGNIYLMRVIVQETSTPADVSPCGSYGKGETEDFRLRSVAPSNDLSIDNLAAPFPGDCAVGSQYITISIKNNGTIDQSNVPISAVIKSGTTTVANLTGIFKSTITALSLVKYTFSTPFTSTPGATYTITTSVDLVGDQNTFNNTNATSVTFANTPAAIVGTASICNNQALLNVTNPSVSTNYFWYTTASATTPFATGSTVSSSTIPSNNTFYLGKEFRGSIGPVNKNVFTTGGYNTFSGNFVNFSNSVPLTIESAKLYIGSPGTIEFIVGNFGAFNADGSFSYMPISRKTIDVYATSPVNYTGGNGGINLADTGAIFNLNLSVPTIGDHIILIDCKNGASIFRNNGIGINPYPFSLPNVMSITGNSATTTANPTGYQGYYYFFYDMRINTNSCVSDRSEIIATVSATPVLTQSADSLVSSLATGNQWYLNDSMIVSANGKSFKPLRSGAYKSVVIGAGGCVLISNTINYVVTALAEVMAREIKLSISPNPSNGRFGINFEVPLKKDLSLEIINANGQKVFAENYPGFVGKYGKTVDLSKYGSDFYVLKIQYNNKTYLQKILIQK